MPRLRGFATSLTLLTIWQSGCWEAAFDRPIYLADMVASPDLTAPDMMSSPCTPFAPTSARPALVPIMPGAFVMGSPPSEANRNPDETQHKVNITRAFLVSETEVTQSQYFSVRAKNPSGFVAGNNPVDSVSWFDAAQFCNALSAKENLETCYDINGTTVSWIKRFTCRGYRLLTEAEWEYVARAGQSYIYPGGSDPTPLAWFQTTASATSHPVKEKQPNAWGIYDMAGNVYEYVWDWYQPDLGSLEQFDPVSDTSSTNPPSKIVRSAGWDGRIDQMRVAWRSGRQPDYSGPTDKNLGIRIGRSCD